MDAYVEFWNDPAGMVRVGEGTRQSPDPYEYALSFTVRGGWATFHGLCFPCPLPVMRLAFKKVEAEGLRVRWERTDGGVLRQVVKPAGGS